MSPYKGQWPEVLQKVDVERMNQRYGHSSRCEVRLYGAPWPKVVQDNYK